MNWNTTRISIQAGEYKEAQAEITRHSSTDGRFIIERAGGMSSRRSSGVRGPLTYRWRWTGYRLIDTRPEPWQRKSWIHPTVAMAKAEAERRSKRG